MGLRPTVQKTTTPTRRLNQNYVANCNQLLQYDATLQNGFILPFFLHI